MNNVPKVDKTVRNQTKKIPVPPSVGMGNPATPIYGPGKVATAPLHPAVTTGKPGVNRGRRK